MSDDRLPPEYEKYKSVDPFPKIPPALLNSADISDYAHALRLIDPFDVDKLKPASYEVPFAGTVYWWDPGTKERCQQEIRSNGDSFELKSNAIAYVCPDTTFYLPDYIAFRFNLQITEVHRGLLLGTGPIVDPGFCGRLLIPLHNMTANKYTLFHGKGLIWVEFTKLSPNSRWHDESTPSIARAGVYKEFPKSKRFLTATDYFAKATGNLDIVSSIPDAVQRSQEDAKRAADNATTAKVQAEKAASTSVWTLAITIIGLLVAVFGGGYQLVSIYQTTLVSMLESRTKASEDAVRRQLDGFQKELDRLKDDLAKAGLPSKPLWEDMGDTKKPEQK